MKLLTPIETRNKKETQNIALSSRGASLDEAIVTKRKELLSLDEEFLRTIENNRAIRVQEENQWEGSNSKLRVETEELENRKRLALLPLEQREKEIENAHEVLSQREEKVSKKEDEVSKNLELLELRLDDASERLENVHKRSQELDRREKGVEAQETQTRARTNDFNALLTKTLTNLDQQRLDIALRLKETEGKEMVSQEKETRLKQKEQDLVSREIRLADRYAMLERTTEEQKRKGLLPTDFKF